MIVESLARATEALCLAKKRSSQQKVDDDFKAALESAEINIKAALTEFNAYRTELKRFFGDVAKYGLGKVAELGSIDDLRNILHPKQ